MDAQNIKSHEPRFNGRQTVIRLPGGVYKISLGRNGGRVAGINGNDGKNDTFGIFKDRYVTPEADEWSEMLLPWTVVLSMMTVDLTQSTKKKTTASQNTAKDTASAKRQQRQA
ncbi:hypothetical protein [Neisseria meningitidis]|uniref:hypothetical protein n=1 Tax=Neisseria meningitidis TaxID=487 RepID=UPI0009F2F2D6